MTRKSPQKPIRCILDHLENPHLNGILLGLDSSFAIKAQTMNCCEGTGFRFDETRNMIRSCKLKTRHKHVLELVQQFQTTWPYNSLPMPSASETTSILSDVAGVLKGSSNQASLLVGQRDSPGQIWPIALTMAWRFGLRVKVINLNQKGYQATSALYHHKDKDTYFDALIVEQVMKFGDENDMSQLEAIISYAYNANLFLWIELILQKHNKKPRGPSNRMLEEFNKHIDQLRNQQPEVMLRNHLGRSSFSQLSSLLNLPKMSSTPNIEPF